MSTLVLLHTSVTLYILVITIGQEPALVSVLDTVKLASGVQSVIVTPMLSNSITVVTGGGRSEILHPLTKSVSNIPVTTGAVSVVTVKTALHVLLASQLLVTVNVTVLEPPHRFGAPVLLLVVATLHPPVVLTVASHLVNLALIESWV